MKHKYYVYILSSLSGILYVGVTNNLERRVYEHKNGLLEGFSKKYRCHALIYHEEFNYIDRAIEREKQLKKWSRKKKMTIIETLNPEWKDLATLF